MTHPIVRDALAVAYLKGNGRRRLQTFYGNPQGAREFLAERDSIALARGGERPRLMRWNGTDWDAIDPTEGA